MWLWSGWGETVWGGGCKEGSQQPRAGRRPGGAPLGGQSAFCGQSTWGVEGRGPGEQGFRVSSSPAGSLHSELALRAMCVLCLDILVLSFLKVTTVCPSLHAGP